MIRLLHWFYSCLCIYISEPLFFIESLFFILFFCNWMLVQNTSLRIVLCIIVYVTNKDYLILSTTPSNMGSRPLPGSRCSARHSRHADDVTMPPITSKQQPAPALVQGQVISPPVPAPSVSDLSRVNPFFPTHASFHPLIPSSPLPSAATNVASFAPPTPAALPPLNPVLLS